MTKHYHLVGIGGIGMSSIAHLLLHSGITVSGSDLKENKTTDQLKKAGAQIFIGHKPENITGADLVVYSSAISENNPEIVAANKLAIPLIKRAQALAELMLDKTVITVSGSHGKTTTTSLVSCLLLEAGFSPTAAIGGILINIGANACLGKGKFFIAEADESDGSFLYYRPKYSIITNIDREHLDYYKEFDREVDAFGEFIAKTGQGGCVFACADDANLKKLLSGYKKKHLFFGLAEGADIYAKNMQFKGLTSEFDCFYKNKFLERFYLNLGGAHNISNSLAVIALGLELGISIEQIKKALSGYKGARRRLEIKFKDDNCIVIDDYAHHPTEIKAALSAVKNMRQKRVFAIFQPHRYSRTKLLLEDFSKSFSAADCLIITDIYPASELPIEGVSAKSIYDMIKEQDAQKEVIYLPKEEIIPYVLKLKKSGDLIITLGAGDIVKISDELVESLKKHG